VSPVPYEQGFYIPEDDILHSHRRHNIISYIDNIIIAENVECNPLEF
jgi:hypothetical protein